MVHLEELLLELPHLNLEDQIVDRQGQIVGYGGSCDVFCAFSQKHKKRVAVKRIRAYLEDNPSFLKRLAKEIQIWAKLHHSNVLPFLGFFVEGKNVVPSLISEWMVNGTLDCFMKRVPRGGVIARIILRGVASGLTYLHSQRVIHADLKSANILMSSFGTPLLADFGLSLALTQTQSTQIPTSIGSSPKGTVRWMAVELLSPNEDVSEPCRKHDEKSDVWAFGMIVYELLSWKLPYSSISIDWQVAITINKGSLPQKPEIGDVPSVFNSLWDLAGFCWIREPIDRPTARVLLDYLSTTIESPISEGCSYTRRQRWRKIINACIAANRLRSGSQRPRDSEAGSQRTQDQSLWDLGPSIVGDLHAFAELLQYVATPTWPELEDRSRCKSPAHIELGPSTKDLDKKIKDVSRHAHNVRSSFQGVHFAILEVGFPSNMRVGLTKEWTTIVTKFNSILKNSGESASKGYETLTVFLILVLPCLRESEDSVLVKLALLAKYKETVTEGCELASRIWNAHDDIQNKIVQFKETCCNRTETVVQELRAKISHAENRVSGLRYRFQRLREPSVEEYLKKNRKVLDRAKQAIQDIGALGCVWKLFLNEIRGLETSLDLMKLIPSCPWRTKERLDERLNALPRRYVTLKACLQMYTEAVSKP